VKTDYLIVGQGLAGSLLAWHLIQKGKRVLVVDRDEENTSSKVAAGLMTPVAGARFKLPAGLPERLSFANQFYWDVEERTGQRFFHHKRIARLFRNAEEPIRFQERSEEDPELKKLCAPLALPDDLIDTSQGGFEMKQGGWLDVPAFLECTRQWLLEQASYAIGSVRSEEVKVSLEGIRWKNIEAESVVFAQGWQAADNHFFDWLPMNSAAGDILTVEIPDFDPGGKIINKGKWLLPIGGTLFKIGSNYRHDFESDAPCPQAREDLERHLRELIDRPFKTVKHECAIRPIIRRSQVFAGRHPGHEKVILFNGLGSKGVLNGPWHADRLADHLIEGTPLPDSVDLRSNLI